MMSQNATDAGQKNGHDKSNGHDKTPEEIQLEIARTRSAITEDLKVLSERFGPQQLKESAREVIHEARVEATELMRDAKEEARELMRDAKQEVFGGLIGMKDRAVETVSDGVSMIGERASELGVKAREAGGLTVNYVSNHAVLLSVLGAGAGWLLMALRNYRRVRRGEYDYRYEHYSYPLDARASHPERPYGAGAPEFDAPARSSIEPRAATLATRKADEARELARGARNALRRGAGNTAAGVRATASNNGVAVVALTVVAGLGLGLLLPIGRRPRRALLHAGERVWDGAQATARDVADRTRHLARDAADRARHLAVDAKDRGLTVATGARASL
jgi:hypothetical protein